VLIQRGYPRRHARAIATYNIAAFRGLLIDLVANDDRDRLDDAAEIFAFVTEVMEAKGPLAASEVLQDASTARASRSARGGKSRQRRSRGGPRVTGNRTDRPR